MPEALFDTTVFIDYYNGYPGAGQLVSRLLSRELTASFSPITVFELWLREMPREEEIRYSALLRLMEEAPLVSEAARLMAGWLRGFSRDRSARMVGDAMIAATAAQRGETLYTRNVTDFQRFYTNAQSY